MTNAMLLPLPGNATLARALAAPCDATLGELTLHTFPDRETVVRIDTPVTGRALQRRRRHYRTHIRRAAVSCNGWANHH